MEKERLKIDLPTKLQFLFERGKYRYKVAYGGRCGMKSQTFAKVLIILAAQSPLLILCAREFQNSIRDSVYKELVDAIYEFKLDSFFTILKTSIVGRNGSEFIFAGLHNNVQSIKSIKGIDICWVEEASTLTTDSWEKVVPTIRKKDSEIWLSFNPDTEDDIPYKTFSTNNEPPPRSKVVEIGYEDADEVGWFPDELRYDMEYVKKTDYDRYMHIWKGKPKKYSEAQILKHKWRVEDFTPDESFGRPYFGADWGFSNDPTALVKCWVKENTLYIEHEAFGYGVDIDKTPELFDTVHDARKNTMYADCARPETISYMKQHGYPLIRPCEKWKGSVEDGVMFLRSFESIIIHPRCKNIIYEAGAWKFKVIEKTGEITTTPEDKDNHGMDSLRYALGRLIKRGNMGILDFYRRQAQELEEKKAKEKENA